MSYILGYLTICLCLGFCCANFYTTLAHYVDILKFPFPLSLLFLLNRIQYNTLLAIQYNTLQYNTIQCYEQVKTEGLELMEALSAKLYIAKRTITAIPSVTVYEADVSEDLIEEGKVSKVDHVIGELGMNALFRGPDESLEPVS